MASDDATGGIGGHVSGIDLFDVRLNLLTTVSGIAGTWNLFSRIQADGHHTFYFVGPGNVVHTVDDAGNLGAQTWTPPIGATATRLTPMAPSLGGSLLYYGDDRTIQFPPNGTHGAPIQVWDLVTDSTGGTLIPSEADTMPTDDLVVLPNGQLLVTYESTAGGVGFMYEVRRYSSAGALLATYPFGEAGDLSEPELALDPLDDSIFWFRSFLDTGDGEHSTFYKIRISDGATLVSFSVHHTIFGGTVPLSCPIIVLSFPSPVTTSTPVAMPTPGETCPCPQPKGASQGKGPIGGGDGGNSGRNPGGIARSFLRTR
jgi:hypothetical protein